MAPPRGARTPAPRALLAVALLTACAARGADPSAARADPPDPTTEPAVAKPLTPAPARTYVDGAALDDDAALLSWLEASGGKALRLPVRLTFDDEHRLAIQAATVGGVPLKLDDTAMGVAVLDQVRRLCPAGEPGCTVWLEGTWGAVLSGVPMPGLSGPGGPGLAGPGPGLVGPGGPGPAGPTRHPFAVRRVGGPVDGTPTAAQIEG